MSLEGVEGGERERNGGEEVSSFCFPGRVSREKIRLWEEDKARLLFIAYSKVRLTAEWFGLGS